MSFSILCLLFSSFVFAFFSFCRAGVSLSRGLCWFIPGVAVEIPHAVYLLTCWSASPKQVWSQHLVAWEPSCFLSTMWHGEVLYGLGIWGFGILLLLGGIFSAKCGSSFSARFLIYICFLPLVVILDPLNGNFLK
jgi:hypothetical protein